MTSFEQLRANRRAGRKSTGPITQEGRERRTGRKLMSSPGSLAIFAARMEAAAYLGRGRTNTVPYMSRIALQLSDEFRSEAHPRWKA
jgi:hypothetical protein